MNRDKIFSRLNEQYKAITDLGYETVGIFLQGSQNYRLDYEDSDIDSKVIVLPKFDNFVLNKSPASYTHVMPNEEHVDVKDIRLMFDCFKKQNINFIEILFTEYRILNPKYQDLYCGVLDKAEEIAHYNNYAAISCMVGMVLEKYKALEHPYPATAWKIEKYGCDFKQYHHILRIREFMERFMNGEKYSNCLVSNNAHELIQIKKNNCTLEIARENSRVIVDELKQIKNDYFNTVPLRVDKSIDNLLNSVLLNIIKRSFIAELELKNA